MNCPSCGRALASGTRRCVYCGHGTEIRQRPQLAVPKGTVPERRGAAFPWRKLLAILVLAGIVAAAILHPALNAKVKELLGSLGF